MPASHPPADCSLDSLAGTICECVARGGSRAAAGLEAAMRAQGDLTAMPLTPENWEAVGTFLVDTFRDEPLGVAVGLAGDDEARCGMRFIRCPWVVLG